ncbi:glycosyltransferase family 4 protein [Clostridium algidicarnis]|uniref:glycosyltransferase family 4 protein n=1 Tax=Clostridium algidicarnis TaxID=37659 RepID=UPI001C0D88D5|nr:glycosyltransferase family 1 protein [Clostridium algidicarnis]MBU3194249.1 glycosyltransferase family 4 protein [Clostridium algidicarnis]MCB2286873.1 glycosyltransferase family 4 protein [Clostridium algidicarnis]
MRFAIDARGVNWYRGTGIGTYTENVLSNLLNLDKENFYNIYWYGKDYELYEKSNTDLILCSKKHNSFFNLSYFPKDLEKKNIDLYHIPQNGIGLNKNYPCKTLVTIHDLIPYIMPETVGKGYLTKFLREMPEVIDSCESIITVSEWSKQDILKFFPMDPDRIFVTPLAADKKYKPLDKAKCKEIILKSFGIDKKFILYLGGFSPRKNVRGLIKAFKDMYKDLNDEYELVILGSLKDEGSLLLNFAEEINIKSKIHFLGFVAEEMLPIFYNSCECFVYPSLYEGFGLPPLEAMSCGCPLISSNTTSIPEVVKDAGYLIDSKKSINISEALFKVLSNEDFKINLSKKALSRSLDFSWEITSKNTLDAYTKVANSCI